MINTNTARQKRKHNRTKIEILFEFKGLISGMVQMEVVYNDMPLFDIYYPAHMWVSDRDQVTEELGPMILEKVGKLNNRSNNCI